MESLGFPPALSTLTTYSIPFVLQKVGEARVDPGVSCKTKTPGALITPHSVTNPAALGEEEEGLYSHWGVNQYQKL